MAGIEQTLISDGRPEFINENKTHVLSIQILQSQVWFPLESILE